jgi:hypothetical protein
MIPPHPAHLTDATHRTPRGGWRELAAVAIVSALLAVALTYPLAFRLGRVGRIDNADGQLSIWNVSWVARTIVVDPAHVFDANIFYPHRGTLAYSESNLGAGILASPVYWATRNPYAAHNFVVLLAFVLSAIGTYYLVRYLTGDRRGAAVSAVCFACCPFVFAHLPHIQLQLTAGLPFTMLAFHRLADRPSTARGAALGGVMAAQALCCGYYGVYAVLIVGVAVFVAAAMRSLWTVRAYWIAIAIAAGVALLIVTPAFLPYLALRRGTGFHRELDDARSFAATLSAYLASSSYAHVWMLRFLPQWGDVLFPGFLATGFGLAGIWLARRLRRGETVILYAGLTIVACWASFGPAAGLYTVLYKALPFFGWLRAPVRFGLLVDFGLSVLAGAAVAVILDRRRHATLAGAALVAVAVAELAVPLRWPKASPVEPVYQVLATLPPAPVIEMPFYYPEVGLFQHAQYMLKSTAHWMPMVNGYSDYIPEDFLATVNTLAPFPSRDAFKILEPNRVRYAVFHLYGYNTENRNDVLIRLKEFERYLRPLYMDESLRLYEITGFPP